MKKQSIFIVEDEIITAKSIAKNVRQFGYQVSGIATSGSVALTEIFATKPDLVLMDIRLDKNDIDGITTAKKLQCEMNVPIIYLTAHCDRKMLDRAKITTPFGYILKPYNKKDLQIGIEFALHKHQQEIQLVKREELLSTILNAAQDGVVATDKTSSITYMNPAAENLTGWELDQAYKRRGSEILQIIDRRTQKSLDPIKQVLEQGEVVYLNEYAVLLKRNGEQTYIRNSASPINKGDLIKGVVLIFAPRSKSNLTDNVNQESVTTANNKKLNELSCYLMDLLLHELRTPLTVILSTSQSLQSYRQKWTVKKQDRSLKRIQQAVAQITHLLDNVSVWDELGKEQVALQTEWINAVALSREIISNLELIDENHHLVLSYRGEERAVHLDRDIVQYILTNLLLNGMKYSPEDSTVSLLIKYEADYLILQVSDRGIGIPQAEQGQIFEPFFRASNTGRIKGTGLGLAIVKEYVQLCRGEITLESSPSKTIFTVRFPTKN